MTKKTRFTIYTIFHGFFLLTAIVSLVIALVTIGLMRADKVGSSASMLVNLMNEVLLCSISVTLNYLLVLGFDVFSGKKSGKILSVIGIIATVLFSALIGLESWSPSNGVESGGRQILLNLWHGLLVMGIAETITLIVMKYLLNVDFEDKRTLPIILGSAFVPLAISMATFFLGDFVNIFVRAILIFAEGAIASKLILFFLVKWQPNNKSLHSLRIVMTVVSAIVLLLASFGLLFEEEFLNLRFLAVFYALAIPTAWIVTFFNFNKLFKDPQFDEKKFTLKLSGTSFAIALGLTILSSINPMLVLFIVIGGVILAFAVSITRAVKSGKYASLFTHTYYTPPQPVVKKRCIDCIYCYVQADWLHYCSHPDSPYYCSCLEGKDGACEYHTH